MVKSGPGVIVALALSCASLQVAAESQEALGQGRSSCADFMQLVDGDWSHPLNALNFHGYISWAQGYLSARGAGGAAGEAPTTESIKLWLAEYCRDHTEESFASAVDAYAQRGR